MRALVIGGGVGGPAVAVALRRLGHEVELFEARLASARADGLFLTLAVNGMRALRELDLLDAVLDTDTVPTPTLAFLSSTGKPLASLSNGALGATPCVTLRRSALQEALLDAARARGVAVHHGRRFVGCEDTGAGVVARFADGTTAHGDLLAGADGLRSGVRRACFPDAPDPSYVGLLNLGGFTRLPDLPDTGGAMRMIWGRRAFFGYITRRGGETWWFANVEERGEPARGALEAIPTDAWKDRLRALFADDPPVVRRLVDATPDVRATPVHDLPRLPRWHTGRVALLGDAAHAVSPSAGQGASLALEDAVALAKCLRDVAPVEAALARYEALRRPRAERVVADGRRRGFYKAPRSELARAIRDLVLPLVLPLVANERRLAWLYDHRDPWDAPVA